MVAEQDTKVDNRILETVMTALNRAQRILFKDMFPNKINENESYLNQIYFDSEEITDEEKVINKGSGQNEERTKHINDNSTQNNQNSYGNIFLELEEERQCREARKHLMQLRQKRKFEYFKHHVERILEQNVDNPDIKKINECGSYIIKKYLDLERSTDDGMEERTESEHRTDESAENEEREPGYACLKSLDVTLACHQFNMLYETRYTHETPKLAVDLIREEKIERRNNRLDRKKRNRRASHKTKKYSDSEAILYKLNVFDPLTIEIDDTESNHIYTGGTEDLLLTTVPLYGVNNSQEFKKPTENKCIKNICLSILKDWHNKRNICVLVVYDTTYSIWIEEDQRSNSDENLNDKRANWTLFSENNLPYDFSNLCVNLTAIEYTIYPTFVGLTNLSIILFSADYRNSYVLTKPFYYVDLHYQRPIITLNKWNVAALFDDRIISVFTLYKTYSLCGFEMELHYYITNHFINITDEFSLHKDNHVLDILPVTDFDTDIAQLILLKFKHTYRLYDLGSRTIIMTLPLYKEDYNNGLQLRFALDMSGWLWLIILDDGKYCYHAVDIISKEKVGSYEEKIDFSFSSPYGYFLSGAIMKGGYFYLPHADGYIEKIKK